MKLFIVLNLLCVLGVSLAMPNFEEGNDVLDAIENGILKKGIPFTQAMHKTALKRVVRDIEDFHTSFSGLEKAIQNCRPTYRRNLNELKDILRDMEPCLRKKKITVTPRDEYLENMDNCTAQAIKQSKRCLPREKRYFPKLYFEIEESQINFLYDDLEILRGDVATCMNNISNITAVFNLVNCLITTGPKIKDLTEIPPSSKLFCQNIIQSTYCYTDMLRDNCDDTENLRKFRKDFINSTKRPCGEPEI